MSVPIKTFTATPNSDKMVNINQFQTVVFIICSGNEMKVQAVREAINSSDVIGKLMFDGYLLNGKFNVLFESLECKSYVPEQPIEKATWVGAQNRVRDAKRQTKKYLDDPTIMPIYVAIENGLFNMSHPSQTEFIDCPVVYIVDGEGMIGKAIGSGCPVNFTGLTYESKTMEHRNTDYDSNVQKYRKFVKDNIPDNSISTYFTRGIEDRVSSMRIGVRTAVGNLIRNRIINISK